MKDQFIRNILLDLVLTLATCGLFNFYVQYQQCEAANDMLKEDKYSFFSWFVFCLITCGFYHIYHEYRKSSDIANVLGKPSDSAGLIAVVLTLFGGSIICDAIQQSEINRYYGSTEL